MNIICPLCDQAVEIKTVNYPCTQAVYSMWCHIGPAHFGNRIFDPQESCPGCGHTCETYPKMAEHLLSLSEADRKRHLVTAALVCTR